MACNYCNFKKTLKFTSFRTIDVKNEIVSNCTDCSALFFLPCSNLQQRIPQRNHDFNRPWTDHLLLFCYCCCCCRSNANQNHLVHLKSVFMNLVERIHGNLVCMWFFYYVDSNRLFSSLNIIALESFQGIDVNCANTF